MSYATDIILTIGIADDERRGDLVAPGMAHFRAWCEDESLNGHPQGIGWPERAKAAGSKPPMVATYAWCVNYLDEDGFLAAVAAAPWRYPNDIQVLFRHEGARHFRMYTMDCDRGWVESRPAVEEWHPPRSGPKFVPLRTVAETTTSIPPGAGTLMDEYRTRYLRSERVAGEDAPPGEPLPVAMARSLIAKFSQQAEPRPLNSNSVSVVDTRLPQLVMAEDCWATSEDAPKPMLFRHPDYEIVPVKAKGIELGAKPDPGPAADPWIGEGSYLPAGHEPIMLPVCNPEPEPEPKKIKFREFL